MSNNNATAHQVWYRTSEIQPENGLEVLAFVKQISPSLEVTESIRVLIFDENAETPSLSTFVDGTNHRYGLDWVISWADLDELKTCVAHMFRNTTAAQGWA